MSLQLAAQHIAHKGRGPDTTLVHMSRNEVKSLNDLAMAHGGQLTINPQTGLPEAGFLSMILPMVAGAALGPAGFGLSAGMAGLAGGALSYALNPKAGLMGALSAGMGAYGGAGLASGLSNIATSESGLTSGMSTAADEAEKKLIADRAVMAQQQAAQQAAQAANTITPNAAMPDYFQDFGAKTGFESAGLPTPSGGYNVTAPITPSAPNALDIQTVRDAAMESAYKAPPTGFDAMSSGAKSLFTDPTADKFKTLGGGSYMGLAQKGLAAAAPALVQPAKLNMPAATSQKSIAPRYKFNPGMTTPTPAAGATGVENTYFRPQYTTLSDEEAKSMYGYAGGGPVELMSNQAVTGANTHYPMANIGTSAFATPYQDPRSTNMLASMNQSSGDTVDMMSGEPNMQGTRMAAGGVSYDPQTQRYTNTGGIADAYRPENTDVNVYNDTGGVGTGAGPSAGTSSGSSSSGGRGSATGSLLGDVAYGISNQGFSPLAAALAGLAMDAMSSTSNTSANATNGMDVASDAASAMGAGTSAGAAGPAGESSNGMGSDTGGESGDGGDGGGDGGEARGGLSPYFTHHMASGGGAKSYRTTLDDSLETAYAKAQESNDTATMRAIEAEMEIRNTNKAGMEQGLSGMKGLATGGLSNARYNLGGYSDGGRLLRGPGDGVSDSIPAVIGKKQPARLADGEFVVPARIVSEIGNGSTEAGARKLYAMMDRIQAARGKTVGKGKVAKNTRADKYLPA